MGRPLSKKQAFTLVELIIVITILGILAATAAPRLINMGASSRRTALESLDASMRSALARARGDFVAQGGSDLSITRATGSIAVTTQGHPTNEQTGIGAAMGCVAGAADCQGFLVTFPNNQPSTWRPSGGSATCQLTYAINASNIGTPVVNVSAC